MVVLVVVGVVVVSCSPDKVTSIPVFGQLPMVTARNLIPRDGLFSSLGSAYGSITHSPLRNLSLGYTVVAVVAIVAVAVVTY